MFNKLLNSLTKVNEYSFKNQRDKAIYELGIETGRKKETMQNTGHELLIVLGTFAAYKFMDYMRARDFKEIHNSDVESIVDAKISEMEDLF